MNNLVYERVKEFIIRTKFLPGIKRAILNRVYAIRYVPKRIYDDDIFLVSYPKSGNTWVRFMLANLICPEGVNVDFNSVDHIIPEVYKDNKKMEQIQRPRFIKSHAPFHPRYPRVIYVARDGRDVYISYYHYEKKKFHEGFSLTDYLKCNHWPCSWSEHIISWLNANLSDERLLVVCYERLREEPEKELRRIASFSGFSVTDAEIVEAVRCSTFKTMRKLEETQGHPRKGEFSGRFVRQGSVGGWRDYFGAQEKALFKASDNDGLVLLGYEQNAEW